ncbi:MAG: EamA family transporter [Alphaproteobacteria bacterium]
MNSYLIFAFSYPLLFGFVNIIDSRLTNRTIRDPLTLLFYMSLTNLVFLPLILFFGTPTVPSPGLLVCYFLLALLDLVYQVPYYRALKKTNTSIVGALFSLGRVFIPVLTWLFLDERLKASQYAGFVLIIGSAVLLSIRDFRMPRINAAFFLMLLSSSIRSVFAVLEKYTIDADGNWINMVIYPAVFAFFIPFALFFFRKSRRDILDHAESYRRSFGSFAGIELLAFTATSVMFFILPHISAVVKTSVSATMPIFILASNWALYRFRGVENYEELSPAEILKKTVCFIVMTAGVALLVR